MNFIINVQWLQYITIASFSKEQFLKLYMDYQIPFKQSFMNWNNPEVGVPGSEVCQHKNK